MANQQDTKQSEELSKELFPRLNQTFNLSNGRVLGFAEFGPINGRLVFFLHGSPGNRLEVPRADEATLEKLGIRLVCLDRPGYGLSSDGGYKYTLLDIAKDVGDLANHLLGSSEGRFDVMGVSAGGPYALGVAYLYPDRVQTCSLISSIGSIFEMPSKEFFRGMDSAMAVESWLHYHFPTLGYMFAQGLAFVTRFTLKRWGAGALKSGFGNGSPDAMTLERNPKDADGAALAVYYGLIDTRAYAYDDGVLLGKDWQFSMSSIRCSVHIWHGSKDPLCPIQHAYWMASKIPGSRLHLVPDKGHLLIMESWIDILSNIVKPQ